MARPSRVPGRFSRGPKGLSLAFALGDRGYPRDALRGPGGAQDSVLHDARPPHSDDVGRGVHLADGRCEGHISVDGGVHRLYGAGEAVVRHLGHLVGCVLREGGVGSYDAQSSVLPPSHPRHGLGEQLHGVAERAVVHPGAGDHTPRVRVADIAEGIDCGKSRDDEAAVEPYGHAPDPPLHRPLHPEDLADGRACARADAALREVPALRRGGGLVAHREVGADRGISDEEVEEDGGGDQRDAGHPYVEADTALLKVADDPFGGGEAEGAPPGQQEGVGLSNRPVGAEAIRLPCSRRGAAHVHADDGTLRIFEEDGRAAGQGLEVGGVAHEHAGHVAEVIEHGASGVRVLRGLGRLLPLLRVRRDYARVVAGQAPERDELLLGAGRTEPHEDGVSDHRVVDDLALPLPEPDGRVLEGRAFFELLVDVVLVAHATLNLTAAAHDLLVRGHALLLGEPHVDCTHAARSAPGRAAQWQPARVAAARIARALDKPEPPQHYLGVVEAFETLFDRVEVRVVLVRPILDFYVVAVERDVAADELDLLYPVVAGELLGLVADLSAPLPVLIVLPRVLFGDYAEYVVGFGIRFAAPRRQGDAPDELPHLGRDDDLVADPEV